MKKRKREELNRLRWGINLTIACTACGTDYNSTTFSQMGLAQYVYERGWRTLTDGSIRCARCFADTFDVDAAVGK